MNNSSFSPIIIEWKGSRLMFLISSFFCLVWWLFLYNISKSFISFNQVTFLEYTLIAVAFFGLIPVFIGVSEVYNEKIKITPTSVSYFKNGWFRKPKVWEESFMNYIGISKRMETGISSSGVDMSVETDILSVVLIHKNNIHKNIILKKNIDNIIEQNRMQEHYSKIFDLPITNDSASL